MALTNQHPEDIKAEIRKSGVTVSSLGDAAGLGSSTMRASLTRCIPAGNQAIAKFLDRSVHEIWPEWYDKTGNRLVNQKHSRGPSRGEGQKRGAA